MHSHTCTTILHKCKTRQSKADCRCFFQVLWQCWLTVDWVIVLYKSVIDRFGDRCLNTLYFVLYIMCVFYISCMYFMLYITADISYYKSQFPCAFCSWTIYFAHSHTMNVLCVCVWFCFHHASLSMCLSSKSHFHTNRQTLSVLHWQFITQHHYSFTHYPQHHYSLSVIYTYHYSLSVIYTFSFHVKVKPKGKNQTNGD